MVVLAVLSGVVFSAVGVNAQSAQKKQQAASEPTAAKKAGGAANAANENPWSVRCGDEEEAGKSVEAKSGASSQDRVCEAFQRLVVSKTGKRVAEFAIGYPKDRKEARGVVILPLGILLADGVGIQIDEGQQYRVKPRYCTPQGCFSFISVNDELMASFKKGSNLMINARALNGKDVRIKLSLKGFANAVRKAKASKS